MLEQICEPLRKTVSATLKDNAVKQEIERHEELVCDARPGRALRARARAARARIRALSARRRPSAARRARAAAQVRSGLRVSYLLSKVSGAEGAPKFDEYVRQTLKQGKLAARYEAICAEVDGADDDAEPMSM